MVGPDLQQYSKLSQRLQARLGLPDGYSIYSPFPFQGVNQKDSIYAIADQEFVWCENFLKQGNGFLRTLWDHGTPIYVAPADKTIVWDFFYNIGDTDYAAVFLSDGTAIQVDTVTFAQTVISSVANTFYRGTGLPGAVQWGSRYLLIGNNNTVNDYWVWDGAILYGSGGLAPTVDLTSGGSGYTSAPSVAFFGGSGSGAAGYATIANGSVNNVVITNPGSGYLPGDIVQLVFTGGGQPNSAQLVAVLTPGSVGSITLTAPGSGYTVAPGVTVTGGGGSGATAHAVLGPNVVASVSVGAGGAGYTTANVLFSGGGGSGAAATATVAAGAVTVITMTNLGSGYTSAPTVTISGDGTGATGTAHLGGSPVASIVVDTPGTGYTSAPAIGFTGGGGGTGAAATSQLITNSVASVTVVDGGGGFATAPTLTFEGGGGTGAEATAVITGGIITGVTVTNGGSGYTTAPAVIVQSGVSSNASGMAELMPFGVSGDALETYQSRVWIFHPADQIGGPPKSDSFAVSAPGSLTDFSLIDGGTVFQSSDSFLRKQYTAAKQSNGYLYPIGDSSVEVISNVQTAGNPVITTFNYQNADPQAGTSFRDTVQAMGQTIFFTNMNGMNALRGGSVAPVSDKIDNIFDKAVFPPSSGALTPSSAVVYIHKTKYYITLMTITDPFTELQRDVLVMTDQKGFYIGTQTTDLKFISTQIVNSDMRAYGTDGLSLFRLFTTPSTELQKFFVTKAYGADKHFIVKQSYNVTLHGKSISGNESDVSVVMNSEQGNFPVPWSAANLTTPLVFTGGTGDIFAAFVGVTVATTADDLAVYNLSIGYTDIIGPLGSDNLNAPAAG